MYTFEDIRKKGLLLFEVRRGSHAFGLATEKSDIDTGGVYIAEPNVLMGIRNLENTHTEYQQQISSEKNDDVWYELGTFMELLSKSNPTALEILFAAEDCILYEHPMFHELRMRRNEFISRNTVRVLDKYAEQQLRKAVGQKKMIHWDEEDMRRKTPMDFCFTLDEKQGSKPMQQWLDERGLRQDCCGLVNIPNMPGLYGVYYDFGQHFRLSGIARAEDICGEIDDSVDENIKLLAGDDFVNPGLSLFPKLREYILDAFLHDDNTCCCTYSRWKAWFEHNQTPIGKYCGIVKPSSEGDDETKTNSTAIRYSETPRGSKPICMMSYNDNGYQTHCRKYRDYCKWKKNRNETRYNDNVGYRYDGKNICHVVRLLTMATEVANGKGLILDRRIADDREFLLDVKNHKYTYDEVMGMATYLFDQVKQLKDTCDLPDSTKFDDVDNALIQFRNKFYETCQGN